MKNLLRKASILFICCFLTFLMEDIDAYAEDTVDNTNENEIVNGLVFDGQNYYASINEALENIDSADISLKLLKEDTVDKSFTIAENQNVTIDLNGNKLHIGTINGIGITNNGNLKIKDDLGDGSIVSYGYDSTNAGSIGSACIDTICIDNYSVVTLQNINISSTATISAYSGGLLKYKFLYNHENSTANIDNIAVTGAHNGSSASSVSFASVSMDDFFLYSESACVNIDGMRYSISSKNTSKSSDSSKTTGGNVIYQSGGSIFCNNLTVTNSTIDKGMCVCNNSDVKITNSSIGATSIGLESEADSTLTLDDSNIYSSKYGISNSSSSIKINRSNILVRGNSSTAKGIYNTNNGTIEIGNDTDNTTDNMCIEVIGDTDKYSSAYGIDSDSELFISRAFIYVHGAANNYGIYYTSSKDLVIGNTIDGNNDTLQIFVGDTGTRTGSRCINSTADTTKILSGIYYNEYSLLDAIVSHDIIIGNSEESPLLASPIIYNFYNLPEAIRAEEYNVYYYSGIIAGNIEAKEIILPTHYTMEYDNLSDGTKFSYLDVEKHNLIIHANGGTSSIDIIKVPYDYYIESYLDDDSIIPSRDGYTFAGWTLDEDGKNGLEQVKMEESDIDIYAQWEKNPVKENKPDNKDDNKPDEKDSTPIEKENEIVQDTLNKCIVKVTSINSANRTVAYIKNTSANIEKATIPNEFIIHGKKYKVTEIADGAFKNNKKITSVSMGTNITVIGKNAFQGCTKLKTISIGKNVKTIENNAFLNCTALTKITIPAKVNLIGKNAFSGCKKLKSITIKTKKLTTKNVGKNAFKNINKKATVKVPAKKLKTYKKLLKKRGITKKGQKIKK